MSLCGLSPDSRIVEMVEIPSHPWFIATQAHPELKSRPNRPHPLFKGFVEAALAKQHEKRKLIFKGYKNNTGGRMKAASGICF